MCMCVCMCVRACARMCVHMCVYECAQMDTLYQYNMLCTIIQIMSLIQKLPV